MKPARTLLVCLALLLAAAPLGRAEDALVLQMAGFSLDTAAANDELAAILEELGYSVAVRDPVGGDSVDDITDFACVFDLRPELAFLPPSFSDDEALLAALLAGRGVLFGGEHVEFPQRNASLAFIVSFLGGGDLVFDPAPPLFPPFARDFPQPLNPAHPLAQECSPIEELVYGGIAHGRAIETGEGTWVTGGPDRAGAIAWDRGQLAFAPEARLLGVLDINWASPLANLDYLVEPLPALVETENRAFLENAIGWLCGSPGEPATSPCAQVCVPRNHGFWHRWCLGQGVIDPGRWGRGIGPGPSIQHDGIPADTLALADARLAAFEVSACEALDDGPFSDEREAALRELATLRLNVAAGLLTLGCPVELHPIVRSDEPLTVGDAIRLMEERLDDGGRRALREARWIGAHVVNREALR